MYPRPRISNYDKLDPVKRWQLSDRVFFACGACHILAYAFLERYQQTNAKAYWIRPKPGYGGNHIIVASEEWAFDYHGYSSLKKFLEHTHRRAAHYFPGWTAELCDLPKEVLVSEALSRTYRGLWLREPKQFLHDAMPRAHAYLDRFPPPPYTIKI